MVPGRSLPEAATSEGSLVEAAIEWLYTLNGLAVLVALGVCVFLESAAFAGLFAPGEVALLAAGAAAAGGRTSLPAVFVVGLTAAIAGEATGYEIGRRWGDRLLARAHRHRRFSRHAPRAIELVNDRGVMVVVMSRWNGVMRALVPLVAGTARMRYSGFTAANIAGGLLWVGALTGAGYTAARSLASVGPWLTWASVAAVAGIAAVVVVGRRKGDGHAVRRAAWWTLGSAALSVAIYVVLVRIGDVDIGAAVANIRGWPAAVAVVLELGSLACLGQVYRTTFAAVGGAIKSWPAMRLGIGAFGLAQVLPGGGAVASVFVARQFTRRHGVDAAGASTAVVLFGIVTMGSLAVIASLAAAAATIVSPSYSGYALVALCVCLLVGAVLMVVRAALASEAFRLRAARMLARMLRQHDAAREDWEQTLASQAAHLRHPARLLVPASWSVLNWSLDMAVLTLLAWSVGLEVPVLAVVVAYALGNLLNALPLTPGGVGLVESGIVGTLVVFGAALGPATAAAISYRVVAHWLPLLVAGPVVMGELRRGGPQELPA